MNCATTHLGTKKKLEIHKEGKHGGGRINTEAGFMMVFNPVPKDFETVPQEEVLVKNTTKGKKQQERKTRVETLSKPVKVKKLKTKANLESWKNKYATIKKVHDLQEEHGGSCDFLLLVKNNVQSKNTPNAHTAEKYMVFSKGPVREQFLSGGVKFDKKKCVT